MVMLGSLSPSELAALNAKALNDGRFDIIRQINQQILGKSMGFSDVKFLDLDSLPGKAIVTGIPIVVNGVPYVTKLVEVKNQMPFYIHKHNTLEDGERIRKEIIACIKEGKPLAGIP